MKPVEWSESICVPSVDRHCYRRGTSVCCKLGATAGAGGDADDGGMHVGVPVEVRRLHGVKFDSVKSTVQPAGYSESLVCFVGRSGKHHRSAVRYSSDSKPVPRLRPLSFFETCYVLPPDARPTSPASYAVSVESEAVRRWYSSALKLFPGHGMKADDPKKTASSTQRTTSLPSDVNNNADDDDDAVPNVGGVSCETRRDHRGSVVSYRTRLVVNSVSD